MRISDWSSDVCSSDLVSGRLGDPGGTDGRRHKHPFDFAHIERCRDHHGACEQGELSCPCAHEPSSRGLDGTRATILFADKPLVGCGRRRLCAADCPCRGRSEAPPSELQSLMRITHAVFCLKKKKKKK